MPCDSLFVSSWYSLTHHNSLVPAGTTYIVGLSWTGDCSPLNDSGNAIQPIMDAQWYRCSSTIDWSMVWAPNSAGLVEFELKLWLGIWRDILTDINIIIM